MKKIYTLAVTSLLAAGQVNAQLTQANHAPANGDTHQMYEVSHKGLNAGAAGSGVTWNFAAYATNSTVLNSYTTTTHANTSYPASNVVQGYSASNLSYLNSSSDALVYYGGNVEVQTVKATLVYSAPAVRAKYPMSLNTSTSSATAGSLNATSPLPASGTFTGQSTAEADGTGTLVLSTGTFSNVMRVRTTQTIDFVAGGGLITGTLNLTNYDYYGTLKSPLFSISYVTATVSGQSYVDTLASRNSSAVPSSTTTQIPEEQHGGEISVYPQPAAAGLVIANLPPQARSVEIFDLSGRKIDSYVVKPGKTDVDISAYPGGVFLYHVKNSAGIVLHSGRFTVAR